VRSPRAARLPGCRTGSLRHPSRPASTTVRPARSRLLSRGRSPWSHLRRADPRWRASGAPSRARISDSSRSAIASASAATRCAMRRSTRGTPSRGARARAPSPRRSSQRMPRECREADGRPTRSATRAEACWRDTMSRFYSSCRAPLPCRAPVLFCFEEFRALGSDHSLMPADALTQERSHR